ncbi:MAG: alpha/beta hydrolase [Rhodobacteraceae bacterium]|nr:alpha/beta hydrolase [Paracoccaceae bacterium]
MHNVDFVETGSGPLVVLLHSSVSGARQWRRLMDELSGRYHMIAVNMFGYGRTSPWQGGENQSLEDQAGLVESALPDQTDEVMLVGHSFGGSVAMKSAALLGPRAKKLILFEPNPFYLLRQHGRRAAFTESEAIRNWIKTCGETGDWTKAAERFADYWGGSGTWSATPADRRAKFALALQPNFFEWDAVMNERTPISEWATSLPGMTCVISARDTVRPLVEIVDLMRENCRSWTFKTIDRGGHLAPLTHPDLVNPLISSLLSRG